MAQTDSQYPHLYNEAEKIEQARMTKDLLYSIIMNPNSTGLDKCCIEFVKKIKVISSEPVKTFVPYVGFMYFG